MERMIKMALLASSKSKEKRLEYITITDITKDDDTRTNLYHESDNNIKELVMNFRKLYGKSTTNWIKAVLKEKDSYYVVIYVPSEKYDIKYEVVLKFIPTMYSTNDKINKHKMEVFSNSPSFVFQYAYVANKDGLLVEELRNKVPKKALTEAPKIKNPDEVYSYEKTIFYACKYLMYKKFNLIENLETIKLVYSNERLSMLVYDCDTKLRDYNLAKKKSSSMKKEIKVKKEKPVRVKTSTTAGTKFKTTVNKDFFKIKAPK